ncbi:MAG TPA: radical SAM family heme chaperone HemW [Candidatus Brocadiia bacterium]|nr:radical SAM family heme chaperone HemW [Planctomycetota bacterium]MDO8094698.1 radical SAM family heme chaperone HemW [Candidatus Brocadiales bacterium]
MNNTNSIHSLYIHIPFCEKKCNYCDFNSIPAPSREKESVRVFDEYIEAVAKELRVGSCELRVTTKTVYIGGGTPTSLNNEQLDRLLGKVGMYYNTPLLEEYTIEANPGTLDEEKINILRQHKINRISLGVQSFHDRTLKLLGRIHSAEEAKRAFMLLREGGFKNINIDLIYGCPEQSLEEWREDLETVCALVPEHVSTYCLSYEDGTPLKNALDNGNIKRLDERDELKMYKLARTFLKKNGYRHYEISNFAKDGMMCRHNIVYWRNEGYLGIGAGAFSYTNRCRTSNEKDVQRYIEAINFKGKAACFSEQLLPEKRAGETLVMTLRMLSGITTEEFLNTTGFDLLLTYGEKIARLVKMGLLSFNGKRLRLTQKGLSVADSVMVEFV